MIKKAQQNVTRCKKKSIYLLKLALANGWPMVGDWLANGWRMVGQGLAKGWPRVGPRLGRGSEGGGGGGGAARNFQVFVNGI